EQIWNPDFAFHHASLAANANHEIGVSLAAGGGGTDPAPCAGFLGHHAYWVVDVSQSSTTRWGDYSSIHPHAPDGRWFSVANYFLASGGGEVAQYVMFGRAADLPGP